MKQILLCKYGEIVLKGLNKKNFEKILLKEINKRLKRIGNFKVKSAQSTVYVEPEDDGLIDDALEELRRVFGIVSIARAAVAEKNMESITKVAAEFLPEMLKGYKTFKCDARRSDKKFPLTSPEISGEVGYALLSVMPEMKVDLHNPEIVVMTEVREEYAFIHAGSYKGAGGIPITPEDKSLLLLSGGIDSPVAGYMIAKRGVALEAVYYESYPYTSEQAREKVVRLAEIVSRYSGRIKLHVVSLTKLQETLRDSIDEDYFTLLLRRSMMRIACRIAEKNGCLALITGESVGQVASQTLRALTVTDAVADRPVLRPCIGMDKEDIVVTARNIGTFETSILPYEDCCTVFTPKHPKTKPRIDKVEEQEAKYDYKALEEEALETEMVITADAYAEE